MKKVTITLLILVVMACEQQNPLDELRNKEAYDSIVQSLNSNDSIARQYKRDSTLKELPELNGDDGFTTVAQIDKAVMFSIHKLYADENMQNYIDFSLKNLTKKSITTVTIILDKETINLKMDLKPEQTKNFTRKTKQESEFGLLLQSQSTGIIKKVRFGDGSFITR